MNGLQKKLLLVGVGAGAVVVVAGVVAVRAARSRKGRHVVPKKVRKAMSETLQDTGHDLAGDHKIADALIQKRIGKLSDKQLIALYAAVKVGGLVRDAGVSFREADEGQKVWAQAALGEAEATAPKERGKLLEALNKLTPHKLGNALSLVSMLER